MAYYADGDDISSNETDRDFERPNTGDFISYEELEDGELLSDDDFISDDGSQMYRANGDRINGAEIDHLQDYLMAKDESPAMRYPGVSYTKCPKVLQFACLPGMYTIHSIVPHTSSSDKDHTSGRIYFVCPKGRDKFIEDWETKYSQYFPDVEVRSLDNFSRATWDLPVKRFTFPVNSPFVTYNQIECCFADLPIGDMKNSEITVVGPDHWLLHPCGPHFMAFWNTDRRKKIQSHIEKELTEQEDEDLLHKPYTGACVIFKSEKYGAARGIVTGLKENLINVYLVDYGWTEDFPESICFPSSKSLMTIPFLAVPCRFELPKRTEFENISRAIQTAKNSKNIQLIRTRCRDHLNIVDAFKNGNRKESCLPELLNGEKPRPIPKRTYTRQELLDLRTDKRSYAFKFTLDHMTKIELLTLFK